METIGNYIFWTSIYLIILGLIHWLLVGKSATPSQNRAFILIGLISSILFGLISLIPIHGIIGETSSYSVKLPEVIVGTSESINNTGRYLFYTISTQNFLLYVSFGISLALAVRLFGSILILLASTRINRRLDISGFTVLPMKSNTAPFSFFGFVFIPEQMLSGKKLQYVLVHEQAHIQKNHSLDLIFVELLTLVFWFHPAIWYLRREIKLQHEFEADSFVLKQKMEKTTYQKMLLDMSFPGSPLTIANPFNYSPLKKRIMMMNKKFQVSYTKAIFSMLAIIPLFAIAVILQSCEEKSPEDLEKKEEVTTETKDDEVRGEVSEDIEKEDDEASGYIFTEVDKEPSFPGGMQEMMSFLQENLVYPEESRNAGEEGTVFVTFVVKSDGSIANVEVVQGVSTELDEEAKRVVKMMPEWEPGKFDGETVNTQFTLPVRFALD